MSSYPVNFVIALFATLAYVSLLSIKSDVSKLGAAQEFKLVLSVNYKARD